LAVHDLDGLDCLKSEPVCFFQKGAFMNKRFFNHIWSHCDLDLLTSSV